MRQIKCRLAAGLRPDPLHAGAHSAPADPLYSCIESLFPAYSAAPDPVAVLKLLAPSALDRRPLYGASPHAFGVRRQRVPVLLFPIRTLTDTYIEGVDRIAKFLLLEVEGHVSQCPMAMPMYRAFDHQCCLCC